MNEHLLTLTLLIVCFCSIGILGLYWKIYQWTQTPTEIDTSMREIQAQLTKFARDTDYRFRQVKTRLADEEREDQKDKAQARYQRRKESE